MRLQRLVYYLAPACLVAIATLQLCRAHSLGQSPWAGGGFGMFAVIDGHPSRFVRIRILTADGAEPVGVPPGLEDQALAVRVVPTPGKLAALGQGTISTFAHERPGVTAARVEALGHAFETGPPRVRLIHLGQVIVQP